EGVGVPQVAVVARGVGPDAGAAAEPPFLDPGEAGRWVLPITEVVDRSDEPDPFAGFGVAEHRDAVSGGGRVEGEGSARYHGDDLAGFRGGEQGDVGGFGAGRGEQARAVVPAVGDEDGTPSGRGVHVGAGQGGGCAAAAGTEIDLDALVG